MRVALITNIPAPYRIPAWNIIGKLLKDDFVVFFCSHTEHNRHWDLPEITFKHVFLKENYFLKKDNLTVVHNNKDIFPQLKHFNPDIVITGGFNPTYALWLLGSPSERKKHIATTDAWLMSEKNLGFIHRTLRKIVYRCSAAVLPCSIKGREYFKSYGNKPEDIFICHYAVNADRFANDNGFADRPYDLLFSGQFIERKNPLFFVRIVKKLQEKIPGLKVLLLGAGPLKEEIITSLNHSGVDYNYAGYAKQEELPHYYSQSKLFLFPTEYDAWGVVAHEALAAGTPVITTPEAGCADELVLHEKNGYVLPLEETNWVKRCIDLLTDQEKWKQFSAKARETAVAINAEEAAASMISAFEHVSKTTLKRTDEQA